MRRHGPPPARPEAGVWLASGTRAVVRGRDEGGFTLKVRCDHDARAVVRASKEILLVYEPMIQANPCWWVRCGKRSTEPVLPYRPTDEGRKRN